ncbi:MAG: lamin tail domain-containing protein [Verrucomicrobia bacterium]|nr:lamin tail domain-containing protein [Verrucomicrobiota bacterium]MBI3870714.1 lamin tail domain-containing protein [Verrucomicrobiota bacterium]
MTKDLLDERFKGPITVMFNPLSFHGRKARSFAFLILPWVMLVLGFVFVSPPRLFGNTVVLLGAIQQIAGPQDLDLDGEFTYAINFSPDDPVRTVHGVKFLPDTQTIKGAVLTGPQVVQAWQAKPEFGSSADANQLEEILFDIRWANSAGGERLRASLTVTNGEEYKLQILISGNNPENRRWDIRLGGLQAVDEITSLGASPGQSYSVNRATLYTYQFVSTTNRFVVEMGDLFGANEGGDRNPIWQALTLEHIAKTPAPDDIALRNNQFFPNQSAPIGHLDVIDRKSGATHALTFVPGAGDTDNAKFTLLNGDILPSPFDFSGQAPGATFSVRVRATDTKEPARLLEKSFTLAVAAPHPPTAILLDASSLSARAQPGALLGNLSAADPDAFDRVVFSLVAGLGDDGNGLVEIKGTELRLSKPLPLGATSASFRLQARDLAGLTASGVIALPIEEPQVRVNEMVATGIGGVPDENSAPQDWIELYNERPQWVDLGGYYLTDQHSDRTRWKIPSTLVPPNGFVVILADGRGLGPPATTLLHANFALSSGGSRVELVAPDGSQILGELRASEFFPGVAFGIGPDGKPGFIPAPTPGKTNGPTTEVGANEVTFSAPHGFFTKSFLLTLTSTIPDSIIRYTADGSVPTATHGTTYTNPIPIKPNTSGGTRGTRIIRAFAQSARAAYAPIQTQTYLFINGDTSPAVDGVVSQSVLTTTITKHPVYGPLMDDALLALPAVSVVLPQNLEVAEHPASIELFDPQGKEEGFQIDCGITATGTTSLGSPKLSMAAHFSSDFGHSRLQYPLFARGSMVPDNAATSFKSIRLRSHSHDTFYWLGTAENPPTPYGDPPVNRSGDAQLTRNPWIDEMQLLMGQPGKHGRQVHLFLNGEYHGIYHIHEHADDDYMASYYQGNSVDFHFTAAAVSGSDHGDQGTWRDAWTPLKASLNNFTNAQQWIDLTNLCDYMLLSFYAGNDWDWSGQHNWSSAGPRTTNQGGWKFFEQDSDITLQDIVADCTDQDVPDGIFSALMVHPDFRSLFRDRAYRHCYNDGMLTPARAGALYEARMNELTNAIIAETARWQPSSSVSALPWDRDQEWANEWKYLRETYFPQRTAALIGQFKRRAGWWPADPPVLSRLNGVVPLGYPLLFATEVGAVYFTTDGSDPRLPGGKINPAARRLNSALLQSKLIQSNAVWRFLDNGVEPAAAWKTQGFDDSAWKSGAAEIGYGDGDESTVAGFVDTDPALAGIQRNITTYFRKTFDAPAIAKYSAIRFRLVRDDGAVVYLNGAEVWRSNMPTGIVTSVTRAVLDVSGADESTYLELTLPPSSVPLQAANNLLAVEIHQRAPTSPDMSFKFELIAISQPVDAQFIVNQPSLIRARTFAGSDWSGLVEAFLVPDSVPRASAANLLLSEIHYNPMDGSGTEFLEFLNTSGGTIDLSDVVITQAVAFRFPRPTLLSSQQRIVVAKDRALFDARYLSNSSPYHVNGLRATGPWTGSLANEGEIVTVLDALGAPLFSCLYGVAGAWPALANGQGASLELIDAASAPPTSAGRSAWLSDPAHWRASCEFHGTPGYTGIGTDRRILINELVAASIAPATDAIELINVASSAIDLSGWFVTDSADNYRKYRFPLGVQLAPNARLVLRESDFNKLGNPASLVPFAFSSAGEQVFLVSADATGALLRRVDGFDYGPISPGVVIGRWPDTTGPLAWLQGPTLGGPNAPPIAGYQAWAAMAFPAGAAADLLQPTADPDGDGINNIAEYVFALSPTRPDRGPVQSLGVDVNGAFVFSYRRRTAAPEVNYQVEISFDLARWEPVGARLESAQETPQSDASTQVVIRLKPNAADPQGFLFVRVVANL